MPGLGQPFLSNIFDQTPGQDNFLGLSLSRTGDLEGTSDGLFTINEVDEAYAAVVNASTIPCYPGGNNRWTFLIDNISVDGTNVTLSKSVIPGVPSGKLVALLDTGAPEISLPQPLIDAIYSQIPGSNSTERNGDKIWTIPCNTTASVAIQIGGDSFPFHPLDLSKISYAMGSLNVSTCESMWGPNSGDELEDIILGDSFMRNVYSIFNFGNSVSNSSTGNASIQLLSLTDPATAATDVATVRMAQLAAGPSLPMGAIHGQSATSNTRVQHSSGGSLAAAALDTTTSDSGDDSQVKKYAPIVIGLLGGNLLVTLFVVVIGVALCVKRGGKAVSRSRSRKYAKVRFEDDGEGRPLESYDTDKRYSD
ncbi:aspartic peptidase domain-containing protein [Mycena polygramma]|nr:aspartic peptidase domain-containing protein [Mycena polygramma]